MHVVTHKTALGISRQSSLAGTAEAEEERNVAIRADVGAAVQRKHALLRHEVVHEGEDALLHLAGVLRAENHHLAPSKAEAHAGGRGHTPKRE